MKAIEKSTLTQSEDSDLIYSGEKYSLVKQIDGLFYIYMRDIEIGIFDDVNEAGLIWCKLESKSCKLI